MGKIIVSPSILSADFANLERDIKKVEDCGADWVHVDVMDGHFVPNITIGIPVVKALKPVTKLPLDVHLMIENPENYIEPFANAGSDILTFHYEACKDNTEVMEIINYIKQKGRRVGISIKPNTSINEIYEFLPYVHVVLIMTVEPGKGGQELIPETIKKIEKLSQYREEKNLAFDIEADGGIKVENSEQIIDAGADILVAGTAILASKDYAETIRNLRK